MVFTKMSYVTQAAVTTKGTHVLAHSLATMIGQECVSLACVTVRRGTDPGSRPLTTSTPHLRTSG